MSDLTTTRPDMPCLTERSEELCRRFARHPTIGVLLAERIPDLMWAWAADDDVEVMFEPLGEGLWLVYAVVGGCLDLMYVLGA